MSIFPVKVGRVHNETNIIVKLTTRVACRNLCAKSKWQCFSVPFFLTPVIFRDDCQVVRSPQPDFNFSLIFHLIGWPYAATPCALAFREAKMAEVLKYLGFALCGGRRLPDLAHGWIYRTQNRTDCGHLRLGDIPAVCALFRGARSGCSTSKIA
jgi:hypothetical protein